MITLRRKQDSKSLTEEEIKLLKDENNAKEIHEKTDIRGDRRNIALLFLLYVLQGIPLGLIAAVPMLLQNRGASYKQQAEFSFAYWPFSMKLLWAPIVDSLYITKIGRRKSWLIPSQYLIGLFMLYLSTQVERWIGNDNVESNIPLLTILFFVLNFLAATQDIAVDGWALTMLKRCNVGYASTCNSVGQTAGYFLGYAVFIALESKDFCNSYLRSEDKNYGIITLPEFLWFLGICFIIVTTIIAIFKKENNFTEEEEKHRYTENHELSISESYKILFKIMKMRPIQILTIILLTVKVTFAASDAVTSLKLIDAGVPKEKLALLAIPIIPLQIVLPIVVSRYTNGPRPLEIYTKAIPYRIIFASVGTIIAYLTPYVISNGYISISYYILLIINYGIYQIFLYCMFVAIMAFFAKISDPAVGGTYMTFLNTISNLGGNWPSTVVLWLVDVLTWKECLNENNLKLKNNNYCYTKQKKDECTATGGECKIVFDGYYIESIICVIYGIIWLYIAKKWIKYLQDLPIRQWLVVNTDKELTAHKLS